MDSGEVAPRQPNFETDASIRYKVASEASVPVRFIYTDGEYRSASDTAAQMIEEGVEMEEVVAFIQSVTESLMDGIGMYLYLSLSEEALQTRIFSRLDAESKKLFEVMSKRYPETAGTTASTLFDRFRNWLTGFEVRVAEDARINEHLRPFIEELERTEAFTNSAFTLKGINIAATAVKDEAVLTSDHALDIFNKSTVSYYVPMIQFNGPPVGEQEDGELGRFARIPRFRYFKVFKGDTSELRPNYRNFVDDPHLTAANTLYMAVYADEGNPRDVRHVTSASYSIVSVTFKENGNEIRIPAKHRDPKVLRRIIDVVQEHGFFDVFNPTQASISGHFFLYGAQIRDIAFVDFLLNDDLASNYLYVEESNSSYAKKKRLALHFRTKLTNDKVRIVDLKPDKSDTYIANPSSATGDITLMFYDENEGLFDEQGSRVEMQNGEPYLFVNVTKANDIDTAIQFMDILNRLIVRYLPYEQGIVEDYEALGLEVDGPMKIRSVKETGEKQAERFIRLREEAPEVFDETYNGRCPPKTHPELVTEAQAKKWAEAGQGGVTRPRQVLEYPAPHDREDPTKPEMYFICPSAVTPYPGVRAKDPESEALYDYVPCCYKSDQINSRKSEYAVFYGEEEKQQGEAVTKIRNNRFLAVGRYGYLPADLDAYLTKYQEGVTGVEMSRYGVRVSSESLLDAVCTAMNDPDYTAAENKEEFIKSLRRRIVAETHPSLLRQELHDHTDEEIIRRLREDLFFDSSIFYRAVEEYFGINVFVFSLVKRRNEKLGTVQLEIPRHRLVHVRPYRARPTVLLYRSRGAEADRARYPHYEVILDGYVGELTKKNVPRGARKITLYGDEMNRFIYETLRTLKRTVTWTTSDIGFTPDSQGEMQLVGRDGLYDSVDFGAMFGPMCTGQFIDPYGKCRAIALDNGVLMYIPPTSPLNVRELTTEDTLTMRLPPRLVIEFFEQGNLVLGGVSRDENNMVTHLHFSGLNTLAFITVPVIPSDDASLRDVRVLQIPDHIAPSGISSIERIRLMRRTLSFLVSIMQLIFDLWRSDPDLVSSDLVDDFLALTSVVRNENVADTAKRYDISKLERVFPLLSTPGDWREMMDKLELQIPTFINGGKFIFYNRRFYEGMRYSLEKYEKETRGLELQIPVGFQGFYSSVHDFANEPNSAVFTNRQDFDTWLSLLALSTDAIPVHRTLSLRDAALREPYIYKSERTNNYFIVQNVSGTTPADARDPRPVELMESLGAAFKWRMDQINEGYKAIVREDAPYAVYGIDKSNREVLVEEHTEGTDDYLTVLHYGENKYAAMMPLL